MPTTSNFGWTTPADTDLVKDGAAAIRTLGNGIDTSFLDLKGGTTGQILSKASNTDLDFTWIANDVGDITNVGVTAPITGGGSSGSVTIGIDDGTTAQKGAVQLENSTSSTSTTKAATPNSVKSAYDLANAAIAKSLIDAEGDLIVGDAADAVQRLAIGSNGNVLTVDTAVDGKIKWATPAAGGMTLLSTFVPSSSTGNSFTGLSGYKHLLLTWHNLLGSSNSTTFGIRLNNSSSSIYSDRYLMNASPEGAGVAGTFITPDFSMFIRNCDAPGVVNAPRGFLWIYDYANTSYAKSYSGGSAYNDAAFGHRIISNVVGTFNTTSAITSVDIVRTTGSGTFSTANDGVIKLYGVS